MDEKLGQVENQSWDVGDEKYKHCKDENEANFLMRNIKMQTMIGLIIRVRLIGGVKLTQGGGR